MRYYSILDKLEAVLVDSLSTQLLTVNLLKIHYWKAKEYPLNFDKFDVNFGQSRQFYYQFVSTDNIKLTKISKFGQF